MPSSSRYTKIRGHRALHEWAYWISALTGGVKSEGVEHFADAHVAQLQNIPEQRKAVCAGKLPRPHAILISTCGLEIEASNSGNHGGGCAQKDPALVSAGPRCTALAAMVCGQAAGLAVSPE